MCRMNSTLAQLLNSLSLKLNSPSVAANEQPTATANASATLVNPVANTPVANISAANATNVLAANAPAANVSETTSSGEQKSFSTLQTELAEVRKE